MTSYAIGDIHGCWQTLQRLLETLGWQPESDSLVLVGDLVNRGPGSLEVLRWAFANRERLEMVLGNHDLHLIARASGFSKMKAGDTLDEILSAPDRDELVAWLRSRPFMHRDGSHLFVHAGLWPEWSLTEAVALADELRASLSGARGDELLAAAFSGAPVRWLPELDGMARLRNAMALMTRVRTVSDDGRMCTKFTGPPEAAPAGCVPWFRGSRALEPGLIVVFGHWAQLGFYREPGLLGLDSGCIWGGSLTAVRLDDGRVYQQRRCDLS